MRRKISQSYLWNRCDCNFLIFTIFRTSEAITSELMGAEPELNVGQSDCEFISFCRFSNKFIMGVATMPSCPLLFYFSFSFTCMRVLLNAAKDWNTAKERQRTIKDLLNTAKYDKGLDNPKPNPNLTLSLTQPQFKVLCCSLLWYDSKSFLVICGVW